MPPEFQFCAPTMPQDCPSNQRPSTRPCPNLSSTTPRYITKLPKVLIVNPCHVISIAHNTSCLYPHAMLDLLSRFALWWNIILVKSSSTVTLLQPFEQLFYLMVPKENFNPIIPYYDSLPYSNTLLLQFFRISYVCQSVVSWYVISATRRIRSVNISLKIWFSVDEQSKADKKITNLFDLISWTLFHPNTQSTTNGILKFDIIHIVKTRFLFNCQTGRHVYAFIWCCYISWKE